MVRSRARSTCQVIVEVDESYIGGRKGGKRGRGAEGKGIDQWLLAEDEWSLV